MAPSMRACVSLVACLAWVATCVHAQSFTPLPERGPNPVACSNVEQDLTRIPPGETAEFYWRGVSAGEVARYVTSLLVDPSASLVARFTAPDDPTLYGQWSGRTLTYALLVCYPTTSENTRANYTLPRNVVVPRMQRGGEPPIFGLPDRLPVLLFSHGYGGSPLSGTYLDAVTAFASWGYVVVAPFHGDFRYSVFGPDNGGNEDVYVPIWDEFVAMQATRALSLSVALDLVASHAQWRDRVDLARVGAFGISQGGETIMLAGGAALTNELATHAAKRVTRDARIRAGVGYVPYFGIHEIPAFGRDQHGVDGVTLPFLALSGTDDNVAPIDVARVALDRMTGVRGQVAIGGIGHALDVPPGDVVTWTLKFLAAWVDADAAARDEVASMHDVLGGLDDSKVLYSTGVANYQGLWWNAAEPGWGLNLAHQGDSLYLTWYTYDANGKAAWLAMLANRTNGDAFAGDIVEVRGSPYDVVPYDPAKKQVSTVGTGTLAFDGTSAGTFAFEAKGVARSIPITRFPLGGATPACTYSADAAVAAATNYQDLWWGGATQDGWGVNLAHEGGPVYATWYTFDSDGSPLWLAALLTPSADNRYEGALLRMTGPPFGASFDPAGVAQAAVGSARLDVGNGNAATWRYTVGAIEGERPIQRFLFMPPAGTECR
jgi:hypothetical protein